MKDDTIEVRPAKKLIEALSEISSEESVNNFLENFEKVCKIIIPDASTTWEALKLDENKMEGIYDNFLKEIVTFSSVINSLFNNNKICKSLYDNLIECRNLVAQFEKQGLKNKVILRKYISKILNIKNDSAVKQVKFILGQISDKAHFIANMQKYLLKILTCAGIDTSKIAATFIENVIAPSYHGNSKFKLLKKDLNKARKQAKSILNKLKSKIPGKYYISKRKYIAIDKKIDELFDASIGYVAELEKNSKPKEIKN